MAEEQSEYINADEAYNEVYVWGGNFWCGLEFSLLDDTSGQLGLCGQFDETFHTFPKICSFNVVIKNLSCG